MRAAQERIALKLVDKAEAQGSLECLLCEGPGQDEDEDGVLLRRLVTHLAGEQCYFKVLERMLALLSKQGDKLQAMPRRLDYNSRSLLHYVALGGGGARLMQVCLTSSLFLSLSVSLSLSVCLPSTNTALRLIYVSSCRSVLTQAATTTPRQHRRRNGPCTTAAATATLPA